MLTPFFLDTASIRCDHKEGQKRAAMMLPPKVVY